MSTISAGAGRHSHPKRHGIGGVGCDGSDSAEQQSREGDEAAAARDRVKRAAERARDKQEDCGFEAQVQDVSRLGSEKSAAEKLGHPSAGTVRFLDSFKNTTVTLQY